MYILVYHPLYIVIHYSILKFFSRIFLLIASVCGRFELFLAFNHKRTAKVEIYRVFLETVCNI